MFHEWDLRNNKREALSLYGYLQPGFHSRRKVTKVLLLKVSSACCKNRQVNYENFSFVALQSVVKNIAKKNSTSTLQLIYAETIHKTGKNGHYKNRKFRSKIKIEKNMPETNLQTHYGKSVEKIQLILKKKWPLPKL